MLEVASDVTVLRDGAVVGRTPTKEMDADRLAQLLLGFSLEALASSEARPQGSEVALQVRDVAGTRLQALDLDLHAGEIVGVTGLLGMGWEELPYLLFDGRRARSGTVRTRTAPGSSRGAPRDAIRAGVVLVPADRLRDSVVAATSVRENLTIPWVGTFFRRGALRHRAERSHARGLLRAFDVRPPETERRLATLSGGNQQKVVVARWFELGPGVLLLHEPTQGVDVGARREIYARLQAVAAEGVAVLLASGEFQDLERLCDRVHIFRDGRIVSTLAGESLTYARIVERAFATSPAEA